MHLTDTEHEMLHEMGTEKMVQYEARNECEASIAEVLEEMLDTRPDDVMWFINRDEPF